MCRSQYPGLPASPELLSQITNSHAPRYQVSFGLGALLPAVLRIHTRVRRSRRHAARCRWERCALQKPRRALFAQFQPLQPYERATREQASDRRSTPATAITSLLLSRCGAPLAAHGAQTSSPGHAPTGGMLVAHMRSVRHSHEVHRTSAAPQTELYDRRSRNSGASSSSNAFPSSARVRRLIGVTEKVDCPRRTAHEES